MRLTSATWPAVDTDAGQDKQTLVASLAAWIAGSGEVQTAAQLARAPTLGRGR
jgi:hypothetical protein